VEIYTQLVNGDIASNVHEGALRTPAGSTPVLHSLSLVRDSQEEPLYFVSQYQISTRSSPRARLPYPETRYRMLAENATDIVWQVSAHGILEWVSASVESVLGWSPDDLLGKEDRPGPPEDRSKTDRGKAQCRRWQARPVEARACPRAVTVGWRSVAGYRRCRRRVGGLHRRDAGYR
jgi:PAS domain-containing protein